MVKEGSIWYEKIFKIGRIGRCQSICYNSLITVLAKRVVNAATSLYELIESTVSTYKIDKSNISLTGHSMGGTGTYNIACSYPSLFAHIAPLSGSVRATPDTMEKLKNIPIKAFVGSAGTTNPYDKPEPTLGMKKALLV